MAEKKRVVIDSRLNGASEVQQVYGKPNDPGIPITYYL
jgi:hypothetical protein